MEYLLVKSYGDKMASYKVKTENKIFSEFVYIFFMNKFIVKTFVEKIQRIKIKNNIFLRFSL